MIFANEGMKKKTDSLYFIKGPENVRLGHLNMIYRFGLMIQTFSFRLVSFVI